MDLFWRNYATGQNGAWLLNNASVRSSVILPSLVGSSWYPQGSGDFNRDGRADQVWRNYATGQNQIWLMSGNRVLSSIAIRAVGDTNWHIQGTGDFNGDGKTDLLWRHYETGSNTVWMMNGTTYVSSVSLPNVQGLNIKIEGAADFNDDGRPDILLRNDLSGENLVWIMNGITVASTAYLASARDPNWTLQGLKDLDQDGDPDLIWQSLTNRQNVGAWMMDGLTYVRSQAITGIPSGPNTLSIQDTSPIAGFLDISNFSFSGLEGESGTFQVRLKQAPTSNVTLQLTTGDFLVVDADSTIANGTQTSLTFTAQNWNQARTVWFLAEVDNSAADRVLSNTIQYSLTGGLVDTGVYNIGTVTSTSAPDPTHFNIDLDFRNDTTGFWTASRRSVAQQAANAWANYIVSEWADLTLNTSIRRLDDGTSASDRRYSFNVERFVDDLLVFINPLQSSSGEEAGLGLIDYQFGGWAPGYYAGADAMPRVGQVALDIAWLGTQSDTILYQILVHELGHILGLVGMNWTGDLLLSSHLGDNTPTTAVFRGEYARVANGGNYVPLQSQDGLTPITSNDYAHPAATVSSVMSYGWLYQLTGPTAIDLAMLADSGYQVLGFNVPVAQVTPSSSPELTASSVESSGRIVPSAAAATYLETDGQETQAASPVEEVVGDDPVSPDGSTVEDSVGLEDPTGRPVPV